ncbi:MAG: Fic family protein [Alphaproteobacteria bacterium]
MIFGIPTLSEADHLVLDLIDQQQRQLGHQVGHAPLRWSGLLRRNAFARAIQGSNSIEGINATVDEAAAVIDDDRPDSLAEEAFRAIVGYRNAMTYVLQIHDDPRFDLNTQFIKSLHFMIMGHDLAKLPGQWRPARVLVVHEQTGEVVYEGPDSELVPPLMELLVSQVEESGMIHPIVRGAMAHLNLAMIHPFRDGNGRMARVLQTVVLARVGLLAPVLCSIEEWLGRNTGAYYEVLAAVGGGAWAPSRDASPWMRFCLKAHYQQAALHLQRNREMGEMWDLAHELIAKQKLPERTETAIVAAAFGFSVRNQPYRREHGISDAAAGRDLKRLCEAGLLVPVGAKRGRFYRATDHLRQLRESVRERKLPADPYDLIGQPRLPGIR